MMKRRIFLWMGLIVLFLSFGFSREALAKEAAYKVKRGDSISIIANKHGVSAEALQEANGLDGGTLKTGQSLVIPKRVKQRTAKKSPLPKSSSYRVKKGDNLYSISRKTGFSVSEIKETNNLRSNNLKIGQKVLLSKKADTGGEKTARSAGKSTELADSEESEEEDGGLVDASTDNLPLREADKDINSDAELLGKWHNPEERKLLVKVATAFLGAPYRLGGISLRGLDCSAFVKKIYDLF
ncbi:MAG: LysM peptidoglycan-binding domain-containing protein, partial [Syntrophales bacterium]|nr:LysM peptidoglycan-binding domain-containing protein [Syntrophales bacterium]